MVVDTDNLTIDPFTQVYDALWELFNERCGFGGLVKIGNRISLTGNEENPVQGNPQDADLPDVLIMPGGGNTNVFASSTSGIMEQRYVLRVRTGKMTVRKLFQVKWQLIKAAAAAADGKNLGLNIVRGVRVGDVSDVPSEGGEDPITGKNIRSGWVGLVVIDVKIRVSRTDLIEDK